MQGASVEMPGRYSGAIAVMQEMGWSWPDLCAAPADLVEEVLYRMDRQAHWQRERDKRDRTRQEQKAARHDR
jgi:hypothetical protein